MANSYTNPGGSGPRASINITTTATITGPIAALINGTQANEFWWASAQSGKELKFEFIIPRNIIEAKWYQSTTAAHGDWKWQGSNDNAAWTDIGATFTLGGVLTQTLTTLSANVDFWRYYRMLQVSGVTSNAPYLREIEFNIDDTAPIYAQLTKVSVEQWGDGAPDARLTKLAIEQWAAGAAAVQATLTQMGVEQWSSVADRTSSSFSAGHV